MVNTNKSNETSMQVDETQKTAAPAAINKVKNEPMEPPLERPPQPKSSTADAQKQQPLLIPPLRLKSNQEPKIRILTEIPSIGEKFRVGLAELNATYEMCDESILIICQLGLPISISPHDFKDAQKKWNKDMLAYFKRFFK